MKQTIFSLLLLANLFLISCHKHDETVPYVVSIAINKPTAGQAATRNVAMPIDVLLTRADNATIHNIKIEITDVADKVVETLIDKHYHTSGTVTYTEGGYVPKTAGSFKLKVTATDDDKLQPNVKEVTFTVN